MSLERQDTTARIVERTADVVDKNRDDRLQYALKNGKKFVEIAFVEESVDHLADQAAERLASEVEDLLVAAREAADFLQHVPGDEAEILRESLTDTLSLFPDETSSDSTISHP